MRTHLQQMQLLHKLTRDAHECKHISGVLGNVLSVASKMSKAFTFGEDIDADINEIIEWAEANRIEGEAAE